MGYIRSDSDEMIPHAATVGYNDADGGICRDEYDLVCLQEEEGEGDMKQKERKGNPENGIYTYSLRNWHQMSYRWIGAQMLNVHQNLEKNIPQYFTRLNAFVRFSSYSISHI